MYLKRLCCRLSVGQDGLEKEVLKFIRKVRWQAGIPGQSEGLGLRVTHEPRISHELSLTSKVCLGSDTCNVSYSVERELGKKKGEKNCDPTWKPFGVVLG